MCSQRRRQQQQQQSHSTHKTNGDGRSAARRLAFGCCWVAASVKVKVVCRRERAHSISSGSGSSSRSRAAAAEAKSKQSICWRKCAKNPWLGFWRNNKATLIPTHTNTHIHAYLLYTAYIYKARKHKAVYVHVPEHCMRVCALMTRLMHSSCCCCLCLCFCDGGHAAFGFHSAIVVVVVAFVLSARRWKSLGSFKLCDFQGFLRVLRILCTIRIYIIFR